MEEHDYITVVRQLGRTYREFASAFEVYVGHPLMRWRILFTLSEPSGEWSQKRLVERLTIDPGALTRQLKALEALGWVARSTDARDNRITNVKLTREGKAVVAQGLPRRNAFLRETMGALSGDALRALSVALGRFEARIAEVADVADGAETAGKG